MKWKNLTPPHITLAMSCGKGKHVMTFVFPDRQKEKEEVVAHHGVQQKIHGWVGRYEPRVDRVYSGQNSEYTVLTKLYLETVI